MKPVDIAVILLVIALLALAVYLNRRRKKTGSCCGSCDKCQGSCHKREKTKEEDPRHE